MDRLTRRADFLAASKGKRTAAGGFVLQTRTRDDDGGVRVGFTVSRQVGNAVERNRVRRRLREIARLAGKAESAEPDKTMRNGHDYVLIGRRPALTMAFSEIQRQFGMALRKLHAMESGTDAAGGRRDRHLHETGPSGPKPHDA